jgi:hypothetical protein
MSLVAGDVDQIESRHTRARRPSPPSESGRSAGAPDLGFVDLVHESSTGPSVSTSSAEPLPPEPMPPARRLVFSRSSYRGLLRQPRATPAPSADQVTLEQAAAILGCDVAATRQLVTTTTTRHGDLCRDDALTRSAVEDLATEVYSWRLHLDAPDVYWVTGQRAARILGVSRARLGQLAAESRVPFVRHQDGTRLYRRHQLEILAANGTLRPAAGDTYSAGPSIRVTDEV